MNRKILVRIVDLCLVGFAVWFGWRQISQRADHAEPNEFAATIELEPLRSLAIHDGGRVKSFDSFARRWMQFIGGPYQVDGKEAVYSYFDLMLNQAKYADKKIVYVKRAIRPHLSRVMRTIKTKQDDIAKFVKTGLMTPAMFWEPAIQTELDKLEQDVIRTQKFVGMIKNAMGAADAHLMANRLAIVPPPTGGSSAPWLQGSTIWGQDFLEDGHTHERARGAIPGLDDGLRKGIAEDWNRLVKTWRAEDAPGASAAIASLADKIASVNPELYPDRDKLNLESWYFKMNAFVWVWIVYALAAIPLIMFIAYRMRGALVLGVAGLTVAFGLHTLALRLRWYISGRIPNANMFEAILTSVWFGVL
ncbi:MAG: hypothetical protein GXP29_00560, partial [Planctomycetes bacterium]|nr:hypothetical protein [Planctomycetota bacterium]